MSVNTIYDSTSIKCHYDQLLKHVGISVNTVDTMYEIFTCPLSYKGRIVYILDSRSHYFTQ